MTMTMSKSKFPIKSPTHCIIFNTHHHQKKIPHMLTTQWRIERNASTPMALNYINTLTRKKRNIWNLFLVHSCVMQNLLNTQCYQNLTRYQVNSHKCKRLMDYVTTYPNAYTHFRDSDIILMLGTNAAYLCMPKVWIHISGYYYLGNKPNAKPYL